MRPDILKFNLDVESSQFKLAAHQGRWGIVDNSNDRPTWPVILIWVAAAERANGPDKFYFRFELDNYPAQAPNICIWDIEMNISLGPHKRPKGVGNSGILFRSDWEGVHHLYAPYERRALATHPNWLSEYPTLYWRSTDEISKILEDIYLTLNNPDYHGI